MKLIIDITDHLYSVIKNKECTHNNALTEAVDNGIPISDNTTNGDMIKMIFPKTQIRENNSDFITYTLDGLIGTCVEKDWWNSPYER